MEMIDLGVLCALITPYLWTTDRSG